MGLPLSRRVRARRVRARSFSTAPFSTAPFSIEPLESRLALAAMPAAAAPTVAGPATVEIPLERVTVGDQQRFAVTASVAGGPMVPYLLDTGSSGMFVARYQFQPSDYTTVKTEGQAQRTFDQHYTSGIHYAGTVIETTLVFQAANRTTVSGPKVRIGAIDTASGSSLVADWQRNIAAGTPPYDGRFWGTMGISLVPGDAKKQGNLYTVVAQMPGNLSTGFIIHTGGTTGASPTLTLGLTPGNSRGFSTIPLPAASASQSTYGEGNGAANGVKAWNDKGGVLTYKLVSGAVTYTVKAASIFDTGEPATVFYTGTSKAWVRGVPPGFVTQGAVNANVRFSASIPDTKAWTFTAGTRPNVDQILVGKLRLSKAHGDKNLPDVNTGLGIFFRYDVRYDMRQGTIGFRPV